MDHKCLSWCLELIQPLNAALDQYAAVAAPPHPAPAAALSLALDTLASPQLLAAAADGEAEPLSLQPAGLLSTTTAKWRGAGPLPTGSDRALTLRGQRAAYLPQRLDLTLTCLPAGVSDKRAPASAGAAAAAAGAPAADGVAVFVLDGPDRGRLQPTAVYEAGSTQRTAQHYSTYAIDLSAYGCTSAVAGDETGADVRLMLSVPAGACSGAAGAGGWELEVSARAELLAGLGQVCHQRFGALLAALAGRLLLRLATVAVWPFGRPSGRLWLWSGLAQAVRCLRHCRVPQPSCSRQSLELKSLASEDSPPSCTGLGAGLLARTHRGGAICSRL